MDLMLIDILIFGGIIAVMIILFLAFKGPNEDKIVAERLKHLHTQTAEAKAEEQILNMRRQSDTSLDHFGLENLGRKLSKRMTTAEIDMNVRHYVLNCTAVAFATFFVLGIIMQKPMILSLLIGFIIGYGFPHFYVSFRIKQRQKQFLTLFPDAIELIVRGLRAGLPVNESMLTVSQEIPKPVAPVFREICDQIALGVTFEKAMADMAKDLNLTEFNFFVISVTLQRETGGNLSEILSNLAEVLRQRHVLKLKIRAMSSEARASSYIVGSLPFFVLIALMVVAPEYLEPLIEDSRGNIAIAVACGMLGSGMFIMSKMANFKI